MRKPVWLLIIMILFFVNFAAVQNVAHESDAPFIYYFSREEHAIIIERADGTDRQYIRNPQLPVDHDYFYGLKWSPSGERIAWQSGEGYLGGVVPLSDQAWISSYDGEITKRILNLHAIVSMEWSPISDLLLVEYHVTEGDIIHWERTVKVIIDASTLEMMVQFGENEDFRWTSDGEHLFEYRVNFFAPDGTSLSEPNYTLITTDLSGNRHVRETVGSILWLPDNRLLYQVSTEHSIVENIFSGQSTQVNMDVPTVDDIVWNDSGDYALIYSINSQHSNVGWVYNLWLFDASGFSMQLIDNEASPRLPIHPLNESYTLFDNWIPQQSQIIYNRDMAVFSVEIPSLTRTFTNLPLRSFSATSLPDLGSQWVNDDRKSLLYWSGGVWEFDPATNTASDSPILSRNYFALSDNGQYMAYINGCETPQSFDIQDVGKCILDRDSGKVISLPLHHQLNPMNFKPFDGHLNWNPHDNWIIFGDDAGIPGSSYFYSIAHASGLVYRDLVACGWEFACVDWLPENVPIAD